MTIENLETAELPSQYVLPIHPKEYLYQVGAGCGPRAIKGVLSAFDRDTKENFFDYNKFWPWKLKGWMTPDQIVEVLNENGLEAKRENAANLPKEGKIKLLKEKLSEGSPVILLIGNGYFTEENYSSIAGRITPHYVTLYGYDDKQKEFYVYDPCVKKENYTEGIPIGNKARTYDAVIRDWNMGGVPGVARVGKNAFVSVNAKKGTS